MFCENCGTKNEKEALFCTNCGKKLEPIIAEEKRITSADSEEQQIKKPNIERCPLCQTLRQKGARFCENCGHDFEQNSASKNASENQQINTDPQAAEDSLISKTEKFKTIVESQKPNHSVKKDKVELGESEKRHRQQSPKNKKGQIIKIIIAIIIVGAGVVIYLNQSGLLSNKTSTQTEKKISSKNTDSGTSKKQSSMFKKMTAQARTDISDKNYTTALKHYNQAWVNGTAKQRDTIKYDRSDLQTLVDAQKLMRQKDYQGVLDCIDKTSAFSNESGIVYQEIADLYNQAYDLKDQHSALWSPSKASQLSDFIASWGSRMGQSYKEYSATSSVDMYGISLPGALLSNAMKTEIDGNIVNIKWSNTAVGASTYEVVAAYSDADNSEFGKKHFYLFVIQNQQPRVLITMQNQGNSNNSVEFSATQNKELRDAFADIVNTK